MSAKTTAQPGRRTPLSLTGAVSKAQPNKGGSNAASNNGNNANGHQASNNNKQDNKLQQQKTDQQKSNNSDIKENPTKKNQQPQQSDKKQQQQQQQNDKKSIEKNQNGLNNSKQQQQQQINENKQNQQQNKESKQQNGNNKSKENDNKEKQEKQQDKPEKLEVKSKDHKKFESEIQESNKKDEKSIKEVKDTKEESAVDTNQTVNKDNEKMQKLEEEVDDKKPNHEKDIEVATQKLEEDKTKEMEITEEPQHIQQKSPPSTPKTNKANKNLTSVNKTPTEKTPQKSTTLNFAIKLTPITKREVTTTIDDVEMEPLTVESSPIKTREHQGVANINISPSATSTPGKIVLPKRSSAAPKSDVQLAMQSGYSPERPRAFSQISGRRSIRPITDYTPSKFQSNSQFRESYRRINTELDVTNTSMNVTVGSEVPNNLSFSFFGRGRKRDHTSPQHSQSSIGELHTDVEVSPPKKARFDGFFSVVSSPLTLLRNRFSKATIKSSTPVKLDDKFNTAADEIEVQNVSGVSIDEDLTKNETEIDPIPNKVAALDKEVKEDKSNSAIEEDLDNQDVVFANEKACGLEKNSEQSDITITETPLQVAVGDPLAKDKRCVIM